jgi:hypothetical protein
MLSFWPDPNTAGALNYTSPNSSANSSNPQVIFKIDFKTSDNNRWSGRFSHDSSPLLMTSAIATFSQTRPRTSWLAEITNTRTFHGRFVNVASFHFFRRPYYAGVSNPHIDANASLGVPALLQSNLNPGLGLPLFNVSGFISIGDNGGPISSAVHLGNWQGKDSFSFQHGSHFLQAGVEFRRHFNFYDLANNAIMNFNNRYTGNAFGDFLLGFPITTATGGETNRGRFAQNAIYSYFQDDWKVSSRLNLNLGVRYEVRLPWIDTRGFMSNFNPGTWSLNPPLQNLALQPWQTGRFQSGVPLITWNKDTFMPRVGLAYRLTEKTVIRTGYGIYVNDNPDVTNLQNLGANPRPNAQVLTFNASATTPNISASNPFPQALASAATPTYYGIQTPMKVSGTHAWGLSIQREIARNWAGEIGYQGSHTSNLQETVSFNDAVPGTGNRQARRRNAAFQSVIISMPDADAWYNAMELKLQKRAGRDGISILGAFTWSKSLDDASGDSNVLGNQRQRSINWPLYLNKATSDTHIPRRLVLTVGYDLPFGHGKAFAQSGVGAMLLGGWALQSIAVFQDGPWIPVFISGDPLDTGSSFSQYPDRARNPNLDVSNRTLARWFDTAAFVKPVGLVYGNAGRAPVEGSGLKNVDFSVQRTFSIAEKAKLQFRADAFNISNHPNFGLPGQTFGTAAFGAIGSALDPRFIQLGLKIAF